MHKVSIALWASTTVPLLAQAMSPDAIAGHLQDKSLAYAAIFIACLATGATVYTVRLLVEVMQKSRRDALGQTNAINELVNILRQRPCPLSMTDSEQQRISKLPYSCEEKTPIN